MKNKSKYKREIHVKDILRLEDEGLVEKKGIEMTEKG